MARKTSASVDFFSSRFNVMSAAPSGLYAYPTGHGLLKDLAHSLIKKCTSDPAALGRNVILLPTRRCARLLTTLIHQNVPHSFFMPHLFTFGDLASQGIGFLQSLGLPITPVDRALLSSTSLPIHPLRAHLLITSWLHDLSLKKKDAPESATHKNLSHLLLHTYSTLSEQGRSLSEVESHIPDMHALHWEHYTSLLKQFWTFWPQCLLDQNRSDPGAYKKIQLDHLSAILKDKSDVSSLYLIAPKGLSQGLSYLFTTLAQKKATILFEGDMDELHPTSQRSIPCLAYSEQQAFLEMLPPSLSTLEPWPSSPHLTSDRFNRQYALKKHLSLGVEPSNAFEKSLPDSGQTPLTFWEAETLSEEAQFIALKLRKVLTTPGKTGVLITPNRLLAQRVTQELFYFGIIPDDSYGVPISQTPLGQLMMLSWSCMRHDFSASYLQALLCHPLCTLGMDRKHFSKIYGLLEKHFLRGLSSIPGISFLKTRVTKTAGSLSLSKTALLHIIELLNTLEENFQSLIDLKPTQLGTPVDLVQMFDAHIDVIKKLIRSPDETPHMALFDSFKSSMSSLRPLLIKLPRSSATSYQDTLESYLHATTLPRNPTHFDISILGILEGRLISPDFVILGGLNESTWDSALAPNPWLNQNLCGTLSLDTNKTIQNQIFQEFLSHLCHPEVCLTRAKRSPSGVEKPSRFFLQAKTKGQFYKLITLDVEAHLVNKVYKTPVPYGSQPPAPSPPLALRPTTLLVTSMAALNNNPYSFYVRHILKLVPLRGIEEQPSPRDLGIWIHTILERSLKKDHLTASSMWSSFEKSTPFINLPATTRFFLKKNFLSILKVLKLPTRRICKPLAILPFTLKSLWDILLLPVFAILVGPSPSKEESIVLRCIPPLKIA